MQVDELPVDEEPIDELLARRIKAFDAKLKRKMKHKRRISLPPTPVAFYIAGDPHVDDDGCDIRTLRKHVNAIHGIPSLYGICVGDLTNNWIGRLARLWSNQTTDTQEALRLSEWYLDAVNWLAMIGGNHDCHDEDTEVLTSRGWLHFEDVQDDDEVLGLTSEGEAVWQPIERRVSYDYDGDLVHLRRRGVSLAVTPNHRILHRKRTKDKKSWGDLEYALPGDLRGRVGLPLSGWSSRTPTRHTNAELRVAAWILTDGCMSFYKGRLSRIDIYQRESNAGAVRADLDAMGVDYTDRVRRRDIASIAGRDLVKAPEPEHNLRLGAVEARRVARQLGLHQKETLPEWAWALSEGQFDVFLDGLVAGDGSWKTPGKTGVFYGRLPFVEALQSLCVQNGYSASISVFRGNDYRLNICKRQQMQLDWTVDHQPYEGKVYCLTVPHGNFMVRREGQAHFSGNSWAVGASGFDPLEFLCEKHNVKLYAPDQIRIRVDWQSDELEDPLWVLVRHYFRGTSWFHSTHGANKAAMLDDKTHILAAGHIHSWGELTTEQMHGRVTNAISVRGYKFADSYAMEKGFTEQQHGMACLVTVDPNRQGPGQRQVWWDIEEGVDFHLDRVRRARR